MTKQPKLTKRVNRYDETEWTFEANGRTFILAKTRNWTGRGQSYRTAWYISTEDGEFSARGGSANKYNRERLIAYAISQTATD